MGVNSPQTISMINNLILQKPLKVDAAAWYKATPDLMEQHTLTTKFDEPIKAFVLKAGLMGIPKGFVKPSLLKDFPVAVRTNTVKPYNLRVPPRDDEQKRCVTESYNYLINGQSHLLRAGTGRGKSYIGIWLAHALKCKTLIIVNKQDLVNQWIAYILQYTTLTLDDIGIIQGQKCAYKDKVFTIAMINTAAMDKFGDSVQEYFDFCIVDECHRLGAETFLKAGLFYNTPIKLGLSANDKRSDGLMYLVEAIIGKTLVVSEAMPVVPKVLRVDTTYRIPTIVRVVKGISKRVPIPHSAGRLGSVFSDMETKIDRTAIAIKFIISCHKKGRPVVAFAHHVSMLNTVEAALRDAGFTTDDYGYYIGGMSAKKLEDTKKNKAIVLATYAMCAEATDAPHWSACVMLTPIADPKQSVGRILREYPNKPTPVVLDIVDVSEPLLKGFWYARLKYYSSLNSEVVKL